MKKDIFKFKRREIPPLTKEQIEALLRFLAPAFK